MKKLARSDYILSFWVQGVSVFVTDIHRDAYQDLEVLFVIDNGLFKQYFAKTAYERALQRGLEFYRDEGAFVDYRRQLTALCAEFERFFGLELKGRQSLDAELVGRFFDLTRKLCGDYTKMNFEFTDRAYQYQDQNAVIAHNLAGVARLKDQVRSVMNTVLFEPKGYAAEVFQILARQFDLPAGIIEQLTQVEILALFDGDKPDEAVVSRRQRAFAESYDEYDIRLS